MQFATKMKKIGAVAASALMMGATMVGAADLSNFPSPFLDGGEIDAQIVVGSTAQTADVVGGIQIAARLGNQAFRSETKTVTGAGVLGWSVDGDGQLFSTSNDNIFFGENLNAERDIVSDGDLAILEDTIFEDDSGDTIEVDHDIFIGQRQITFSNDVGDLDDEDPQAFVQIPTKNSMSAGSSALDTETNYLYKIRINFDEAINFSASDVQSEKINLFGTEYTISTDSMSDPANSVVLFGGENIISVDKGDIITFVDEDGSEHTFEVVAITDTTTVAYKLDGSLDSKTEGATVTVTGTNTELLLDEVVQTNSDLNEGTVEIKIGRGKLILQDEQEIQIGSQQDDIDGTMVNLEGLSGGSLSGITIGVAAKENNKEFLRSGDEFIDPVFGAFKVVFGGLNPALDSEDREFIRVTSIGDDTAGVQFMDINGNDLTVEFAHSSATDFAAGTDFLLSDSDDDDGAIVVVEGLAAAEDDFIMADAGGFSHIFEVADIDVDGDTDSDEVVLQDISTGKQIKFDSFTYANTGAITGLGNINEGIAASKDLAVAEEVIDGKTYYLLAYSHSGTAGATRVRLGWGAGAGSTAELAAATTYQAMWHNLTGANETGGAVTLFPGYDTQAGATIAFVPHTQTVPHWAGEAVTYQLPSTESSTEEKTVVVTTNATNNVSTVTSMDSGGSTSNTAAPITFVEGAFQYNITAIDTDGANTITITTASQSTASLNVNSMPALLFIEEEDEDDKESGFVIIPDVDITDDEIEVAETAQAVYHKQGVATTTAPHAFDSLETDTDLRQMITLFGTLAEVDTDNQGHTYLWYPNEQAIAGVGVLALDANLVLGGSSSVTFDQLTPSGVPDLSLLDSEVTSAVKSNSNLILVGGPAVNSLVADLSAQEGSEVTGLDAWRDGAHENTAQIVFVEDAFVSGRAALVVAGHSADDTRAASRAVANYDRAPFSTQATSGTTAISLTSAEYPA